MRELAIGVALGLAAGVAPGPLLALVIGAALERGFAAGARVAAAPLLSDAPVVVLSVLVLEGLPDGVMSAFSIAGGAFVAWLGIAELRAAGHAPARRRRLPGRRPGHGAADARRRRAADRRGRAPAVTLRSPGGTRTGGRGRPAP